MAVEVIGGGRLLGAEEADEGRPLHVVRAAEVLHQVRLLPEAREAERALVRPRPRVRAHVHVHVRLGRQHDPAHAADRVLLAAAARCLPILLSVTFTLVVIIDFRHIDDVLDGDGRGGERHWLLLLNYLWKLLLSDSGRRQQIHLGEQVHFGLMDSDGRRSSLVEVVVYPVHLPSLPRVFS